MKSEAALKATNEPLGLFVSGFRMKGVAKHNELIAPPKKWGGKEIQEELIEY